jgi:aspartate aminotransferase
VRALLPRIRLLTLNTPLNPTGTAIAPETLAEICRDLVRENEGRRARGERPVFLLYDQVYWSLEFGRWEPISPPALVPECAPWVVMLDAISKSLAATGLRVGWSVAAPAVTQRMSDLLGHVGAWAPKAEQVATAEFIDDPEAFRAFRLEMQRRLRERLERLHRGFEAMRERGLPVEAIEPAGTLYLSARVDLFGRRWEGREIVSNEDIRRVLLHGAGIGIVPFQAFGLAKENGWFRLSVGGATVPAIEDGLRRLETLLDRMRG